MLEIIICVILIILLIKLYFIIQEYHFKRSNLYKLASKLSGPPSLPILGNIHQYMGKNTVELFQHLTEEYNKYGPTYKFWILNRLNICLSKPEHLEIIYNSNKCLAKDDIIYKSLKPYSGSSIITAPVDKWKKNRKILNPMFAKRILDGFVSSHNEHFHRILDEFDALSGLGPVDIFDMINKMALDVLMDNLMGIKKDSKNFTKVDGYFDLIRRGGQLAMMKQYNPWFQIDFIFKLTKYYKEEIYISSTLHNFTRTIISEMKQAMSKRKADNIEYNENDMSKPFMERMLQAIDKNEIDMTSEELLEEIDSLVVAGSDSTSITLVAILIMLGMHQDIQQKVYDEIIDTIGQNRDVEVKDLNNFKFMEMVVKETMRLFPAVPATFRMLAGDIKIGDLMLPKGVSIMIPICYSHRNPNLWPEPLKFDPYRHTPEEINKRHPLQWFPFAAGPRNCIGFQFALNEIRGFLSMVLRKYKIFTPYKTVEELKLKNEIFLKIDNGYKIWVERR